MDEPTYQAKKHILILALLRHDYSELEKTAEQICEFIHSLEESYLFSAMEYIRLAISENDTIDFLPTEFFLELEERIETIEDPALRFLIDNILFIFNASSSEDDD